MNIECDDKKLIQALAYQCGRDYGRAHARGVWVWNLLALFLFYMSCDEVAQVHDRVGTLLMARSQDWTDFGVWLYVAVPLIVPFMIFLLHQLNRVTAKMPRGRDMVFLGFLVFFSGAVVCEALLLLPFYETLPKIVKYAEMLIEEGLEMFGVIIIIKGLAECGRGMRQAKGTL